MLRSRMFSLLLVGLLLIGYVFGCGGDDVDEPNNKNQIPTITIEKLRSEKTEEKDVKYYRNRIVRTTRGVETITWRLKAYPAPKTDLVVKVEIGGSHSKWVLIPKLKNNSKEFTDIVSSSLNLSGVAILISPVPMVYIVGQGLVIDLKRFQQSMPDTTREGHIIPEDFDFSLYQIGEKSHILCDRCGVIDRTEDIILPRVPRATRVTVDPAPGGAAIPSNTEFKLTFDQGVKSATINGGPTVGSGLNFSGPAPGLASGQTATLNIEWVNRDDSPGAGAVGPYTVIKK